MDETDTPIRWDENSLKQSGFPTQIWELLDWRPYFKGLDREGCIHMIQALPEDYLDEILQECDATVIIVAYPAMDKSWRRDLVRKHVMEKYPHVSKPNYSENSDGIELKIWTGGWPMDWAFMSEIIREEWSPIWENTMFGRDAANGDVVGALDLAMKPMNLYIIAKAGDTPVYIHDSHRDGRLRVIHADWPVKNSLRLQMANFREMVETSGFAQKQNFPAMEELFRRVLRYL